MTTATMTREVEEIELKKSDSCDRCGYSTDTGGKAQRVAQAFVRAVMPSGSEIMLCKHHGDRHRPALIAQGATIFDYTDRINAKPSVSANSL